MKGPRPWLLRQSLLAEDFSAIDDNVRQRTFLIVLFGYLPNLRYSIPSIFLFEPQRQLFEAADILLSRPRAGGERGMFWETKGYEISDGVSRSKASFSIWRSAVSCMIDCITVSASTHSPPR